ncbi:MAG: hypothetical protein ACHQDB_07265 [Steroidobacterales bacterium]
MQPLIVEVASRIGNLGVEVADIAGHPHEVTTRASQQAAQFKQLQAATETMVAANREIDRAARETQTAASSTGAEITESRALIGGAVGKPFLLQTYRRNMGGGKFVLMKDLSSPIFVDGRLWGAFRMGYQ